MSNPFDIGQATTNGLSPLEHNPTLQASYQAGQRENLQTKSNGSLMRMTPMAIWTSNLNKISEVKKAVYTDVEFIHHNPLVK